MTVTRATAGTATWKSANRVAHSLQKRGFKVKDSVQVCVHIPEYSQIMISPVHYSC